MYVKHVVMRTTSTASTCESSTIGNTLSSRREGCMVLGGGGGFDPGGGITGSSGMGDWT